ncbi:MAG: hypothetical protein JSW16_02895 [Dehalococcoidales bacterium]|nr:MAG: hypothetical protein JSW16_02895 [Dehalococcoidales bacterium]
MPVIRDIPLSLKTREVLRRQGLGGGAKVRPEIKILIRELLASVKRDRLLEPAAAYEYYTVSSMNGSKTSLEGDKAIHGPLIPAIFPEAKELAVLLCTIGPRLEKQVTDYSKSGEAMRGMILDGIGSTAVDMMALEVLRRLASEVSSRGYEISSPVNPGMPGFPLTEQWNLLGLVNADEIGVRLTASGVLVPRKSTSMVIGIGPKMTRWTEAEVCARCSLRETCHYKVTE